MNILVANDDGITARGIKELVEALSKIANVYVSAPNSQRSVIGHGLSFGKKIYAEEVEFENAKRAFSITGTPADCVKIGLEIMKLEGIDIDMVVTGINHGANLGTDTLYSGTVSAAIEGNICGLPAVAVSVTSHDAEHFEYVKELTTRVVLKSCGKIAASSTISINVPNIPYEEIKGVKYVPLGKRDYVKWFKAYGMEDGKLVFGYQGEPGGSSENNEETDVVGIEQGYATITVLNCDFTDIKLTEEIKKWEI